MTNKANNGAVFTRNWIVELILDCCKYTSSKDLAMSSIIEPSCGSGAFLIPIARRLLVSAKDHGHTALDLLESVRAYELDKKSLDDCREKLAKLFDNFEIDKPTQKRLLDNWLINEDYLLSKSDHCADFVIGNPPYIRGTEIDRRLREKYIKECKTMTAGTDIYIGFIETSLRYLKTDGVLSFICADRWLHNAYGKKLRKHVSKNYSIDMILRMHGVDAFETEVSAYPSIIQISNTSQSQVAYASTNSTFSHVSAIRLREWLLRPKRSSCLDKDFSGYWLDDWFSGGDAWPLTSPENMLLLKKLISFYAPLQNAETETQVGIGIATGRDDVFILEDHRLVEECLLLPLITSGQTNDGKIRRKNIWLFNPWDSKGDLIDLEQFPRAKEYLLRRRSELCSRHVVKRKDGGSWYRTIDKVYPDLMRKPKLLIQDMKSDIQPVYDEGNYYPHHNLYWITSKQWNLEVLGGLLISDVIRTIVEAYCVKMRGGTLRLQAQYLRKIRLPNPDSIDSVFQKELVDAFRNNDRKAASEIAREVYEVERIIE